MPNKLKQLQIVRYVSLMLATITLSVVAITATTFATPKPNLYKICDDNGVGLCLKVQSANPPAKPHTNSQVLLRGAELRFQKEFHAVPVRKGSNVLQIRYAPKGKETRQCLAVPNTYNQKHQLNTSVRVEPCKKSGETGYWLYVGKTLVNVGATNRTNGQKMEVLTGNAKNNAVVQPLTGAANQKFALLSV